MGSERIYYDENQSLERYEKYFERIPMKMDTSLGESLSSGLISIDFYSMYLQYSATRSSPLLMNSCMIFP